MSEVVRTTTGFALLASLEEAGALTPTGLTLHDDISYEECETIAATFGQLHRFTIAAASVPEKDLRFWMDRVRIPDPPFGCWPWVGAVQKRDGYGKAHGVYASRWTWSLFFGEPSAGLLVCHACDNPICVNPIHLFLGTYKDNARDSMEKGRRPKASDRVVCAYGHQLDEQNTYIYNGYRQCKKCRARRARYYNARKRASL